MHRPGTLRGMIIVPCQVKKAMHHKPGHLVPERHCIHTCLHGCPFHININLTVEVLIIGKVERENICHVVVTQKPTVHPAAVT